VAADLATQNERLKMNNPTKNGACNWENRVRADWKTFDGHAWAEKLA